MLCLFGFLKPRVGYSTVLRCQLTLSLSLPILARLCSPAVLKQQCFCVQQDSSEITPMGVCELNEYSEWAMPKTLVSSLSTE